MFRLAYRVGQQRDQHGGQQKPLRLSDSAFGSRFAVHVVELRRKPSDAGDCWPPSAPSVTVMTNAVVEAFWARMQVELLNTRSWLTTLELAAHQQNL